MVLLPNGNSILDAMCNRRRYPAHTSKYTHFMPLILIKFTKSSLYCWLIFFLFGSFIKIDDFGEIFQFLIMKCAFVSYWALFVIKINALSMMRNKRKMKKRVGHISLISTEIEFKIAFLWHRIHLLMLAQKIN